MCGPTNTITVNWVQGAVDYVGKHMQNCICNTIVANSTGFPMDVFKVSL